MLSGGLEVLGIWCTALDEDYNQSHNYFGAACKRMTKKNLIKEPLLLHIELNTQNIQAFTFRENSLDFLDDPKITDFDNKFVKFETNFEFNIPYLISGRLLLLFYAI